MEEGDNRSVCEADEVGGAKETRGEGEERGDGGSGAKGRDQERPRGERSQVEEMQ